MTQFFFSICTSKYIYYIERNCVIVDELSVRGFVEGSIIRLYVRSLPRDRYRPNLYRAAARSRALHDIQSIRTLTY